MSRLAVLPDEIWGRIFVEALKSCGNEILPNLIAVSKRTETICESDNVKAQVYINKFSIY